DGEARPLGRRQRWRVHEAVHEAEWLTGLQICVYLGPTHEADPRGHAEAMFEASGLHTRPAVLLLVAPDQRRVEVVTAPATRDRLDDAACAAAVVEMTGHFARGDLTGGLVAGIGRLAAAAGPGRRPPGGEELPDVLSG
ncbi:MAG: DUF5130 domain-containing protein, partial [Actinobacteria bacterium]|nr:DUF5130 domain-containing protein [Actinomycetota bacterium]